MHSNIVAWGCFLFIFCFFIQNPWVQYNTAEAEYVDLMPRYAFRSWKCNKNYITLNSHILWTHAGRGDDVVVVIFRCKCKWLEGERDEDEEATRDTWQKGSFGLVQASQQATINCNSKSLKLQQITGGKLTAKRLRCRRWRRRWRWLSSREMSTCGSRPGVFPAGALRSLSMAPWTEVVLARATRSL